MIWDCFPFFNEFELLKLRCEELRPLGARHVLVESDHTHQGKPKPLYFEQAQELFRDYDILHWLYLADPSLGVWVNERAQRDAIWEAIKSEIKADDVLIV